MKATVNLVEYLKEHCKKQGYSYADLERISGVSWQTFKNLMIYRTREVKDSTAEGICTVLGVDMDGLRKIIEGDYEGSRHSKPTQTGMKALWVWLSNDTNRCSALRAMGYKGKLPD